MQISLGFLRDIVKNPKIPDPCSKALLYHNECETCRAASMPVMHSGCRPGIWEVLVPGTDSLCDLEQDIPSSVAVWSSGDMGERREVRPFLHLLVRLSTTGHSEAENSRTNIAAVFLQGSTG